MVDDGRRQGEPLPPPGREVLHAPVGDRPQPQAVEQPGDARRVAHAVDPGVEGQVFARGQVAVEGELL